MKQRIRVSAIIVEEDRVLLVRHVHPETGFEWWVPPGGGLEVEDKDIHGCAIRETWEETGYSVDTDEILYLREFVDMEFNTHNFEIFLRGGVVGGELTIDNIHGRGLDERYIKEARWIDKGEVKDLEIFPEIIKDDSFWRDYKGEVAVTKYLGKQVGG